MLSNRKVNYRKWVRNIGRVGINLDVMAKESPPEKVRFECRPEVSENEACAYMRKEGVASEKLVVYLNCSTNSKETRAPGVSKVKSSRI